MANRDHEESMTEAEIIDATYWAGFWSSLEHWMFLGVVLTLAVEFIALKFAEPHKEKLERYRESRLVELQNDSERLSKEAEIARKETAQAKLELQRLKNPRSVMPDGLKAELADKPKGKAAVLYVKECSDCEWLASWLVAGLQQSGWGLTNSTSMPLPPAAVNSVLSSPAASAGGQPWGVSVVANTNADGSAQSALMWALTKLLGENGHGGIDKTLPDGVVRVIVAPRP
jgi:hypothetical protein